MKIEQLSNKNQFKIWNDNGKLNKDRKDDVRVYNSYVQFESVNKKTLDKLFN